MTTTTTLQTRFTSTFQCRVPILGAPMAGVSGGSLAAATCRGGGLGFLSAGYLDNDDELKHQIDAFRNEAPSQAKLCLGVLKFACSREKILNVVELYRPFAIQFFAPGVFDGIETLQKMGVKVISQVGCESDARMAFSAGVDCVIAQGREAGGHGLRSEVGCSTLPLAATLCRIARLEYDCKPLVLAAGGIVDGRGLAAALALGCDGCVFGTRLLASKEAMGHEGFKKCLVESGPDDVVRTRVFDTIMNSYSDRRWPEPFDSVGVLKNTMTDRWHHRLDQLDDRLKEDDAIADEHRKAVTTGDASIARAYSGEGVGCIDTIDSAEVIIQRAEMEAISTIKAMQSYCVETIPDSD